MLVSGWAHVLHAVFKVRCDWLGVTVAVWAWTIECDGCGHVDVLYVWWVGCWLTVRPIQPWGKGTAMYALQHGSLFVTTFVFLMVRPVVD